jgi:phage-related minor tail protein
VATTLEELGATLSLDIERFVREAVRAARSAEDVADAARDAGDATDRIEEGAAGAGRAAGKLGDDLDDLAAEAEKAKRAAEGIGDGAGGLDDLGDAAESSAGRMGKIGDAAQKASGMVAGAFAGGAAVDAASKLAERISAAFSEAMDIEMGVDKMQAQLGMSAYGAENYGRMAGELYANAYGDSLEQVNEALVLMNRNVGEMVGEQENAFQLVTAGVLDLASAMDQDLAPITMAIGQMIRTGLARDGAHALDVLTRGFQEGADASEDLLDTFNEYSTNFRDLGLSAEQAMGLMIQGLRAGARDTDQIADGLAEFTKLTKENGDQQVESFGRIGLSASAMARKVSEGGPAAAEALQQVFEGIAKIPDPALRAKTAIELFGTPVEDMAGAFENMNLDTAAQRLGQVAGAADEMGTVLADNAGTRIEMFKRAMQTGLVDFIGEKVLPGLERGLDAIKPLFDGARAAVSLFMSALGGSDESGAAAEFLPPEVIGTITVVAGKLRELGETVLPKLLEWWNKAWEAGEKVVGWMKQNEDVMNGLKVFLGTQLVVALGLAVVGFIALAAAAWSAAAGVLAAAAPAIAVGIAIAAVAAAVSWAYRNWGWFKTAVDAVGAALVWLWNNVLTPVGSFIAGTLVPILGTVIGVIATFIGNLAGWAGNIPQALGAVVEFFEELPGKALGFLSGLWTTVSTWVLETAAALPGLLLGWVAGFWSWLTTLQEELPGKLAYFAGFIVGWIVGMHVVLAENLVNWATAFWDWITTTATELPGKIGAIAIALWAWITQVWEELPGRLQAWWESFKVWADNLVIGIGEWGVNTKNAIFAWVTQVWQELPGRLSQWWEAFKVWSDSLVSSIGQWGIDASNKVRDWVGGIPGYVRGEIGKMADVGRSIVEGIWNGISGAGGWLADRIRNFASGIVSGFMSAIRGGSPAMELVPVGESTIEGVELGMVRRAPRLLAVVDGVMGQMQYGMAEAARDMLAGWDRMAQGGSFGLEGSQYMNERWYTKLADAFEATYPGFTVAGDQAQSDAFEAWARQTAAGPSTRSSGGAVEVRVGGNVDSAMATAIMSLIRSGQIQIVPAA